MYNAHIVCAYVYNREMCTACLCVYGFLICLQCNQKLMHAYMYALCEYAMNVNMYAVCLYMHVACMYGMYMYAANVRFGMQCVCSLHKACAYVNVWHICILCAHIYKTVVLVCTQCIRMQCMCNLRVRV